MNTEVDTREQLSQSKDRYWSLSLERLKFDFSLSSSKVQSSEDIHLACFHMEFHADTPERDRVFLTTGDPDPDGSRYGELVNFNNGKKYEEKHPCNASEDARVKDPDSLPWRRVIISTNAAETAVTFKDCWAVIDTCLGESSDI